MLAVPEKAQQMKPAGAAVNEFRLAGKTVFLQQPDGGHAHALIAHQQVADAENQGFLRLVGNIHFFAELLGF